MTWTRDTFTITCDPRAVDVDLVADFLATSYWARNIPRETVARSIEGSLCFSLFRDTQQIGFARVITDYATFAYLGDVFVLPAYRGSGLGKWLTECVVNHPHLQGLRRWILATKDAHTLYEKLGFVSLKNPDMLMELLDPDVYSQIR